MSTERRFRISHIAARLHAQQSSPISAGSSELVTINPDAAPSIVPHEDPDQLPRHGRFGQAY